MEGERIYKVREKKSHRRLGEEIVYTFLNQQLSNPQLNRLFEKTRDKMVDSNWSCRRKAFKNLKTAKKVFKKLL